jgi:hypothetical protein
MPVVSAATINPFTPSMIHTSSEPSGRVTCARPERRTKNMICGGLCKPSFERGGKTTYVRLDTLARANAMPTVGYSANGAVNSQHSIRALSFESETTAVAVRNWLPFEGRVRDKRKMRWANLEKHILLL